MYPCLLDLDELVEAVPADGEEGVRGDAGGDGALQVPGPVRHLAVLLRVLVVCAHLAQPVGKIIWKLLRSWANPRT